MWKNINLKNLTIVFIDWNKANIYIKNLQHLNLGWNKISWNTTITKTERKKDK